MRGSAEQMEAALYLNHPYGRPVIGWRHEIEGLTREDALEFYRRFYTPNNAILIVAGDVTPEEVKTARRGNLRPGSARRRGQAARASAGAEAGSAAHRHARRSARHPAEPEPLLSRAVLYLRRVPARPKRSTSLTHILGRGANSRLYQKLVVAGRHRGRAPAPATTAPRSITTRLSVYATPKPGTSLDPDRRGDRRGHRRAHRKRRDARRSWIAPATALIADAVYAQDSQSSLARWYGASLATGLTIEQIRTWPDRLRAVTVDDVKKCRARVARQAALGDGISHQTSPARGTTARDQSACHAIGSPASSIARLGTLTIVARGAVRALRPRQRDQDRARRQPRRHRILVRARRHRAAGLDRIRVPRRRRAGSRRQGRARRNDGRRRSTKAPATSTAPPSMSGWSATRSSCKFAPAANTCAARCERSRRTRTRPSTCSGSR